MGPFKNIPCDGDAEENLWDTVLKRVTRQPAGTLTAFGFPAMFANL
jgi:hypothetical protein